MSGRIPGPRGALRQRGVPGAGGPDGPLALIHTNNSPNPASMRVPGRLGLWIAHRLRAAIYLPVRVISFLPDPASAFWVVRFIVRIDAPLRAYVLSPWRRDAAKSTR